MSKLPLVIGAPVSDRGWCLDLYFDSILANCDPESTGLLFVVPVDDSHTCDVIGRRAEPFAWFDILHDHNPVHDREQRRADGHQSLAAARNLLLSAINKASPDFYLSWDTDLLLAPGVIPLLMEQRLPVTTVWTWLNRRIPRRVQFLYDGSLVPVLTQEPMNATAMLWEADQRAVHYPASAWHDNAQGLWACDVALAVQLMRPIAYQHAHYGMSPYGEDIPFNWQLHKRGIQRYCYGDQPGVHLFDRDQAKQEIRMGYPDIMELALEEPLLADFPPDTPEEFIQLGLKPLMTVATR